jgi:hypothetical protein
LAGVKVVQLAGYIENLFFYNRDCYNNCALQSLIEEGKEIPMQSFLHGLILAFGLILPLGVQNLFVFNQGAAQPNFWRALPVVAAASLCDTVLILLAVQGVSLLLLKFALFKKADQ